MRNLWPFLVLVAAFLPAGATTLVPMSLDDLVEDATDIVHAACLGTEVVVRDDGTVLTRADLLISDALKGSPPARVEVMLPGGQVGDTTVVVVGAPQMDAGDEVVLFLVREPGTPREGVASGSGVSRLAAEAEPVFWVAGLSQGSFKVHLDARGVRRVVQDLAGATLAGGAGSSFGPSTDDPEGIELHDFLASVRQRVAELSAGEAR